MKTRNSTRKGMTYRKLSNSNKRAVIASRRRAGDLQRIADNLDYSEQHVSNVLVGRYENQQILNHAYNMVRGRQKNSVK